MKKKLNYALYFSIVSSLLQIQMLYSSNNNQTAPVYTDRIDIEEHGWIFKLLSIINLISCEVFLKKCNDFFFNEIYEVYHALYSIF